MVSGKGGVCYPLNICGKLLLEALGYDIYWITGNISAPDNHLMTIVRNLRSPGDQYLVDVGLASPNFEPIPLDFGEESPVYSQSYLVFKYIRRDGKLIRCHKGKRALLTREKEWREFVVIDEKLTPREKLFLDKKMEDVYTDRDRSVSPFCKLLRVVAFRPDLKCVAMAGASLLLENDSHCLEEVKLHSVKEVLETVDKYFPILSEEAREAVKHAEFEFDNSAMD